MLNCLNNWNTIWPVLKNKINSILKYLSDNYFNCFNFMDILIYLIWNNKDIRLFFALKIIYNYIYKPYLIFP